MGEVVKRMGLRPVVVTKPTDALNVVKLQSVDAAIVDLLLPKMSGVDLVAEFRKTKFDEAPVVLVSGVFKDKNFASEALKNTGAIEFLFKPFGADELSMALKSAFSSLLVSEKYSVYSLFNRKFSSEREYFRAIENIDQIKGPDFCLILGSLMDSGISGHINIVNNAGEIFGVTLVQGKLIQVDSVEAHSNAVLALIQSGYLTQDDWEEYQLNVSPKFSIEKLVRAGYISPHAVDLARIQQITHDLKAICSTDQLQISLVVQTEDEPPKFALDLKALLATLHDSFSEIFHDGYLADFFVPLADSSLQTTRSRAEIELMFGGEDNAILVSIFEKLESISTLKEFFDQNSVQMNELRRAIYILIMGGVIKFSDMEGERNLKATLERYQKLYEDLKGLTPDKVFEYFGAPERAQISIIKNIYDEYVRTNHPEKSLPMGASSELANYSKICFDLVTSAFAVMSDEKKRAELFDKLKKDADADRRKSNELAARGYELLRKNQFQQALDFFRQAEGIFPTPRQQLLLIWALVKTGQLSEKKQLQDASDRLEQFTSDDKKSAFYHMAMGLIKKQGGDMKSATQHFEKVLETDGNLFEARRELSQITQISQNQESKEKLDIFTGDITTIVSNLFRRKNG